jgi:hypothetical protein
MIVVSCLPCALAIRVMPSSVSSMPALREVRELVGDQSDFWPDKFPCPRCEKMCKGLLEEMVDARVYTRMELRDLTAVEAFAAFNGMGFPDEQRCSLTAVRELLSAYPIRKVNGSEVSGQERAVLDSIELWDGTVLHLGASPAGAVVYRVVRPPNYAAKVEDAHG